jgi:Glycosyl transferases group 1
MKILIFLHELSVGGSTVNAIELAAMLRDRHGHSVVLFAPPGPMLAVAKGHGLRVIAAPIADMHPCLARMRALRAAIRTELPDLLYVWETWALIDAYYAAHLPLGMPMLMTDMQMKVNRLLPKSLPSTFGTPELAAAARAGGRRRVGTLLPPVDIRLNAPGVVDASASRARFGLAQDDFMLTIVSRLDPSMKGESLGHAVDAIDALGHQTRLRLLIVGDGAARASLQQRADAVNLRLGRRAVVLAGAMLDPRPAYAVADIVIGMGSSALKGMAFGKAVIVVGEQGFAAAMSQATIGSFYERGLFGVGEGAPGHGRLVAAIEQLANDARLRASCATLGQRFVHEHFALELTSDGLNTLCESAVAKPPTRRERLLDGLRTAALYTRERRFMWRANRSAVAPASDSPAPSGAAHKVTAEERA